MRISDWSSDVCSSDLASASRSPHPPGLAKSSRSREATMSDSDLRTPPALGQFRVGIDEDGIAHLIFDMAGALVNVLSQATIAEIGAVVGWFETADVRGLIIRSAKQVFCAGGDLGELGAAYDRISALPTTERAAAARAHFAPMNAHLLRLERCGKPVAAATAGLALGGGCEFALAAPYRVLADAPSAALGLPEGPIGRMPAPSTEE